MDFEYGWRNVLRNFCAGLIAETTTCYCCKAFLMGDSLLLPALAAFAVPACLRAYTQISSKDPDPDFGTGFTDSYEEFEVVRKSDLSYM